MADKVRWTEEQLSVITSRDQSLLVSAAAGSGKTAVLVQRILDQILDPVHPADIDRMLVVTFTNAAAGQLREKIRERLEEVQDEASEAGEEKIYELASRQLSLLGNDHIETIDRFCREVVLDHASQIGIDPAFRIADEGESKLLQSDAAAQAIEEAYAFEDPEFARSYREFSELYAPGKTDSKLEDMILRFYTFSQSHAFPRIWRHECAMLYRGDASDSEWMKSLLDLIRMTILEMRERLRRLLDICRQDEGPYQYLDALQDDEQILLELENCREMGDFHERLNRLEWTGLGREKRGGPYVNPALKDYVYKSRKRIKDDLDDLKTDFFPLTEEEMDDLRHKTARYMDVLVRLTDHFEDIFSQMKRDRSIADFSDVAHSALRILVRTDEDGAPVRDEDGGYLPTQTAGEYASYFEQIYIDEYQDSNPVQDLLLWSVSREPAGGNNRFMVGDVKQSIYRFRMADPEIFNRKAQTWPEDTGAEHRRIDLHANFRSRQCILDAVNLIFRQIMRREIGGIEYDERELLNRGYPYPEDPEELYPELLLVETGDVPGTDSRIDAEAEAVAQRILQIVGKMKIYDKEEKQYRTVSYGDITILLRTAKQWAAAFSKALTGHGIPNRSGGKTGYFDAVEIRTILAYLNVLDNPRQDIPLAAALRSEIGRLDDRELSLIRAQSRESSFYDSVLHYIDCGEDEVIRGKLEAFRDMTVSLRRDVSDTPIHILLWKIFDETGYADIAAASEGGRQKRANLDLLVDKAIEYEATSYRGLFHFVRYIEKLRKGEIDLSPAESQTAGGDEVTIMTMHASKGLEFPVTFVSGLGKQFNLMDASEKLVVHASLGAGLDYVDSELRVKIPNRIRSVLSDRVRSDSLGEDLRVLYVAMTRAEQKLILSGCVKDRASFLKNAAKDRGEDAEKYPPAQILQANCMLEWVVQGLMRHGTESSFFDDPRWELPAAAQSDVRSLPGSIRIITGEEIMMNCAAEHMMKAGRIFDLPETDPERIYDARLRERLTRMLGMTYRHDKAAGMPGKLSVSELKHAAYEAEIERLEEERTALYPEEAVFSEGRDAENKGDLDEIPVPRFLQEEQEKGLSATALGTACHEVLAALDFTVEPYPGQIEAQLETMVKCDRIHKDEARGIDTGRIERFLKTDLAERMRRAQREGTLRREQPFVIGMRGDEIREEWSSEETVLIQGMIDAFFEEDGNIILIDYKTDRAEEGDENSLVNRYRKQFELYRDALEKLLRKKVTEAWLYSLSLERAIRVPL